MIRKLDKRGRLKKRGINEIDDPMPDELFYAVKGMQEPYRSLVAFLYLTGNRISEVVGIPFMEAERGGGGVYRLKPITKSRIQMNEKGTILRVRTRTLKRPKDSNPEHTYVCRINTLEERRYFDIVKEYVETKEPSDFLWDINRYKAYRECEKATKITLHKLRNLRATRDAAYFRMGALELKKKFNWASSDIAFHYANKNTADIEEKLLEKEEE